MPIEAIALLVHISTISLLIPIVVSIDLLALAWVTGYWERLPRVAVATGHRLVWFGLCLMIASGSVLFSVYDAYLLSLPVFYAKMFFVAALLVNGLIIGRHHLIAADRTFASLSQLERRPLLISGAVSVVGWSGALFSALSLGL